MTGDAVCKTEALPCWHEPNHACQYQITAERPLWRFAFHPSRRRHIDGTRQKGYAAAVAREHFGREVEALTKAAVVPDSTTTSASAFIATALADFIVSLDGQSAGAELLASGLQLSFDGAGKFIVPGIIADAAHAGFVAEAAAIPVRQLSVSGPTLTPTKFAVITIFTREIFLHSVPNITALVATTLTESFALALDTALLDAAAASATRPAGLRNGIAALTASANTSHQEAMIEDITALAGAVSAISGSGPITIVAAPRQALSLRLRTTDFPFVVLASSALANGIVLAIAGNALASALDATPRLDVGNETTLVMATDARPISVEGTPPTIASPTRSLWQTDTIGLRMRMEVSWGLRSGGGLAWMSSVTW